MKTGSAFRTVPLLNFLKHAVLVVVLTVLTQLGGLAWLGALMFRRRLLVFGVLYLALWAGAQLVAPLSGRVALACWEDGPLEMRAWVFCLTNRNYMTPELHAALTETAEQMEREFPGNKLQVLDANFPFLIGFPLLPHLSHDDGEKADLAFLYENKAPTPSPFGYFAFEDGPNDCPPAALTLRWNLQALQPLWPDRPLDEQRNKRLLELLAAHPEISKILLEPHLKTRWVLSSGKIRFQGCRAARHDDHIHVQL